MILRVFASSQVVNSKISLNSKISFHWLCTKRAEITTDLLEIPSSQDFDFGIWILPRKLTNIPWKLMVSSDDSFVSFWIGPFSGSTFVLFFQGLEARHTRFLDFLWCMVASQKTNRHDIAPENGPLERESPSLETNIFRGPFAVI